jgi:hypothetical protein
MILLYLRQKKTNSAQLVRPCPCVRARVRWAEEAAPLWAPPSSVSQSTAPAAHRACSAAAARGHRAQGQGKRGALGQHREGLPHASNGARPTSLSPSSPRHAFCEAAAAAAPLLGSPIPSLFSIPLAVRRPQRPKTKLFSLYDSPGREGRTPPTPFPLCFSPIFSHTEATLLSWGVLSVPIFFMPAPPTAQPLSPPC